MRNWKSKRNKAFAGILAFVMMFSLAVMPLSATAAETDTGESAEEETTTTVVTTYGELKSAIAAGGNITLGADITLTSALTVASGVSVALDLAGHTITGYSGAAATAARAFTVKGSLTVNDSAGTGSIKSDYSTGRLIILAGTLIVNDGELSGCMYTVHENQSTECTLKVNGGTLYNTVANGAVINLQGTADVSVTDGTFEGYGSCLQTGDSASSTISISGGTFTSEKATSGVLSLHGNDTVTISGGEFTKTETNGYVLQVSGTGSNSENITILGGTFRNEYSDTGSYVIYLNYTGTTEANVSISGGEFVNTYTSNQNVIYKPSTDNTNLNITGGYYSHDVSTYTATGYTCKALTGEEKAAHSDCNYKVTEATFTLYYGDASYDLLVGSESFDLTQSQEDADSYGIPSGYLYAGVFSDAGYTTPVTDCGTGVNFTPEADGIYYVKMVSDSYFRVKCLYAYVDNQITSLWPVMGIDDSNYEAYGFLINNSANVLGTSDTAYETATIELEGYDSTSTTCYDAFGVTGYLGVLKMESETLSGYADTDGTIELVIQPYFVTQDGVMVTGVIRRSVTFENGYAGANFTNYTDTTVASSTSEYSSAAGEDTDTEEEDSDTEEEAAAEATAAEAATVEATTAEARAVEARAVEATTAEAATVEATTVEATAAEAATAEATAVATAAEATETESTVETVAEEDTDTLAAVVSASSTACLTSTSSASSTASLTSTSSAGSTANLTSTASASSGLTIADEYVITDQTEEEPPDDNDSDTDTSDVTQEEPPEAPVPGDGITAPSDVPDKDADHNGNYNGSSMHQIGVDRLVSQFDYFMKTNPGSRGRVSGMPDQLARLLADRHVRL